MKRYWKDIPKDKKGQSEEDRARFQSNDIVGKARTQLADQWLPQVVSWGKQRVSKVDTL